MIKEQIGILIKLQALDIEIFKLKREKEVKPREIEPIQLHINSLNSQLKESEEKLKALQVRQKEKEIDLQTKEADVKKLTLQLYSVKTNKEYAAMQKQIEGFKADNSLLEEEIIKIMDELDKVAADISNRKKELLLEENRFKELSDKVRQEVERLDLNLAQLYSERQRLIPSVEKPILSQYERILHNKDGLALVPVEHGTCQGCYMGLPPQVINEIKMAERLLCCESCTRILYIT